MLVLTMFGRSYTGGIDRGTWFSLAAACLIALAAGTAWLLHSMEQRRVEGCLMNLKQIGQALSLYESDWDGVRPQNWIIHDSHGPGENAAWGLLAKYLPNKRALQCPAFAFPKTGQSGYVYRNALPSLATRIRAPLGSGPRAVAVYCISHLQKEVDGSFPVETPTLGTDGHYQGVFTYLREDGSTSKVDAKEVEQWSSDGKKWYRRGTAPKGAILFISTDRFPGEPWPPEFQR